MQIKKAIHYQTILRVPFAFLLDNDATLAKLIYCSVADSCNFLENLN